ncbi:MULTISPECIES: CHRD domain-containing protein [unclassified Nodularia (in: cyanobacteria)]|uniref:CHRD domain-containing protein n=1 Tax=unclassified Nodularia (in: cyanobacteria) TaxID=2656917 RepID=UPI0018810303|nr:MULTISPECIES: CHRD domain-containing protein [unclassified Nodularia (in: cyanobacteria)]MBE9199870.1 CHRD domain-containing protein [Nodularia sp. LEGE 06071]MCC2692263.1 CHRD domain-containing protein [Nodularia sp. LEGE 04288]
MKLLFTGTFLGTAIALTPLAANAAVFSFTSTLNGNQQVPSPVSTTGLGTATGTLTGDPGSWVFEYEVSYSDLQGVIAAPYAHIHNAPTGQNGGVVHDLDNANIAPIAGSSSGTIIGDWRFDDASAPLTDVLAQELLNGNAYFNIHTDTFPSGEIRGQILAAPVSVPEPTSILGLLAFGALGAGWQLKNQKNKHQLIG